MAIQKPQKESEASVIEIVRKMVAEGESEENIVRTLEDLGVEKAKAQRLLLLGQADTFALLRSEISKIVRSDVEAEKPKMIEFIQQEAEKSSEASKSKIEKAVMQDIKNYEKDITGQSKTFQEQINETVAKFSELSERVRTQLNALGQQVKQVQVDMDEFKLKGIGARNKYVSLALLLLGMVFLAADLYLFITASPPISIDTIIVTVILALVGITMLFVATLI